MASAVIGAVFSVVLKALAPVTDPVLEAWAASKDLGPNVKSLKTELLCVKAVLEENLGREIRSSALEELLGNLQDLAYDAEDVLDELEYFRIQDQLHGTFEAVDEHPKCCAHNLAFNASHAAKALVGKLIWSPACCSSAATAASRLQRGEPQADTREVNGCMRKIASGPRNTIRAVGKCLPCSSLPTVLDDHDDNVQTEHEKEITKLEFDRVDASKRIKLILEQLQPMCQKICMVLGTLGSNNLSTVKHSRPATISESVEPKLHGRDRTMNSMIHDITRGQYCTEDLTVIPIVGPGGIGKTTLAQHIYHNQEVQKHFQVKVWECVSLNFNADKITKDIEKYIPKVEDEKDGTPREVIEQRLKSKRFLLILDDIWKDCNEDEWKKVLLPFKKSQVKGNIIIVTTRFPALAQMVKTANDSIQLLQGLNNEEFKELFLEFVFADEQSRMDHPELVETGDKIREKLKGSPLAAKTVCTLLKKHLDFNHWNRVLESQEWKEQKGQDDIMPALKLSYDYLPFYLQPCFSYCALFPQDYQFGRDELIHLWIGLDVLHSLGENKRIEDIGLIRLEELVDHGFLKNEKKYGQTYYVIHDLLHELAVKVSSHECLSIYSYNVGLIQCSPSIRHLSINIDDTSVGDKLNFDSCTKDLISTLNRGLKVENLRSLILFGEHYGSFVKTFGSLFKEAKALRVLFLSEASYTVEDLLPNFFKLIHLRYLRIQSEYLSETELPGNISILYHLMVLDLKICNPKNALPGDITNLTKLRHLLVWNNEMHSSISEVGKLKWLQELSRFVVRKETHGFELRQIGELVELSGSLLIDNLEKVEVKEEVDEAKLMQKSRLHELKLHWEGSTKEPAQDDQVLENLKPNSNLLKLSIIGHGGDTCPSWLGMNLSVKTLESLRLSNISWKTFPPLGEMWFVGEHCKSCIPQQSFKILKKLELEKVTKLMKWVGNGPSDLFSHLEVLIIKDCPELMELPFSHSAGQEQEDEVNNMTWFPKLQTLEIRDCPKLSSLPCVPWSSSTCTANIAQAGSGIEYLNFEKISSTGHVLNIKGKDTLDSAFWRVLAFHNLSKLEFMQVTTCPPLSLVHLEKLSSLKSLQIDDMGDVFCSAEADGHVGYQFPVEDISIGQYSGSGQRLTRMLSYFPNLRGFRISKCEKLTGLGVVGQHKRTEALPGPPSISVDEAEEAQLGQHEQQGARAEEEIAAAVAATSEGVLLLPHQLQYLEIWDCQNLVLCPGLLDQDEDAGRTGGGGLQGLSSLTSLRIEKCPGFLSSYSSSSSSPCFPFPTSLEHLRLVGVEGMETLLHLSNLTSLTRLDIRECGDLRGLGLWPLLAQGRLTKLTVRKTPKFFAGSEPTLPREQEFTSSSSKLQELETDDVVGVLAASICVFLSSLLTELHFWGDKEVERFTKEQEEALQLLTSLESIRFWYCDKLQCLSAGLHRLPNLKRLGIFMCAAIRSLPKDGLPSSLQELAIHDCPAIRSIPKECLPISLQKLEISGCPAIRSLPKVDDVPSSLRELDVHYGNSEELRRQCRKLIGTIPIVRA